MDGQREIRHGVPSHGMDHFFGENFQALLLALKAPPFCPPMTSAYLFAILAVKPM